VVVLSRRLNPKAGEIERVQPQADRDNSNCIIVENRKENILSQSKRGILHEAAGRGGK